MLRRGLDRPLTLISAPAGFGKTSLVGAWRTSVGEHGCSMAWLTLDDGDNDPVRFWYYAASALESVRPGAAATARSLLLSIGQAPLGQDGPGWLEAVVAALINDLAAAAEAQGQDAAPLVWVLDDYHTIRHPAIHDSLAFFIEHMPHHVHVIILTRADPLLPLARLRARDLLVELRAADLRFSATETEVFLNQVMALGLPAAEVRTLEARTEGWAAGLRLAALSLRGRDVPLRDRFISDFSGTQHYVFAYLVEEVLGRQPPELQAFLLRTSILSYLSAPLCDAVLAAGVASPVAAGGSQGTLARLEQENLFVVPLDEDRRWYRYHPLFADALRARLVQAEPALLPELHRRAAAWYVAHGQAAEAVRHCTAAGDLACAGRLIEAAYRRLVMNGELATLRAWLNDLPEELLRSRPRLALARAWSLGYAAPFEQQEQELRWVEAALQAPPERPRQVFPHPDDAAAFDEATDLQQLRGELLALRALLASRRWESKPAVELAQDALWLLWPDAWAEFFQGDPPPATDPEDIWLRAVILQALGSAYRLEGNVAAAETTYREALRLTAGDGIAPPFPLLALSAAVHLGQVLAGQLRLREAEACYREALDRVRRDGAELLQFAGEAFIRLGEALAEQDRLAEAVDTIRRGLDLCRRSADPMAEAAGYLALAGLARGDGAAAAALAAVGRAEQCALRSGRAPVLALVAAQRARLALVAGELAAAARWADELPRLRTARDAWPLVVREAEDLLLAAIRLAQGRPAESVALLGELLAGAEAARRTAVVVEALALQALALDALGEPVRARSALVRALALAGPEGCARPFVVLGPEMARLLSVVAPARGVEVAPSNAGVRYAVALLARSAAGPAPAEVRRPPAARLLVEPLTARELEILRQIAAGASNQEIAERCVLSVGTVKGHVNHILGKLAAHNRTEAAARARELGLLRT
jgi:LuxR family maltose regulon positive regulatory protein